MRRNVLLAIMAVAALASISIIPPGSVSAASADVSVGDFWVYETSLGGIVPNVTTGPIDVRMEVVDKISKPLAGQSKNEEMLRLDVSASGTARFELGGVNYSSTLAVSGFLDRLASNFSLADLSLMVRTTLNAGIQVPASFGFEASAYPTVHDYIGTDAQTTGTTVKSNSALAGKSWFDVVFNQTQNLSETFETVLSVQRTDVQVTVPAGTFTCVEVKVGSTVQGNTSEGLWYYSSVVGNYVKMQGTEMSLLSILGANASLVSYSHHAQSFSLFSGTGLIILIVVIAVVVVGVVAGAVLRSRHKG